jgi:ferric-dicitrate binding protein FerR (iron transport regulator)
MARINRTEEERIAKIIEAFPSKESSTDALLDTMFEQHSEPTPRTYQSLARLHERLGLPATDPRLGILPPPKRISLRRRMLRVAAVLIPIAVVGGMALWLTGWPGIAPAPGLAPDDAVAVMVEVLAAGNGMVTLPDGSTVRPVGESRVMIEADFDNRRRVALTGEAFFSVVPDATRPFTVETDGLSVTVLGTEFNLKAWPDQNRSVVSVVSGSVKIEGSAGSEVLRPMQRLVYDSSTHESAVEQFSPDKIDRWRSGRQAIDGLSLGQALRTVGHFYCKSVVIEGILPSAPSITTVLSDAESVEAALDAIRAVHGVFEYRIEGDTVYVFEGD